MEQGALPLEEVEEVSLLSSALMAEEEEQKKPVPRAEVAAQNCHHLSGSVCLFLALTFVDCQDAFCTKDVVAPRRRTGQYAPHKSSCSFIHSLYVYRFSSSLSHDLVGHRRFTSNASTL